MRDRRYGQFCGLARAAEVLGQRWTLLILRDLLVGPRRFSDLEAGLPGIPTSVLATRLKELERDGLIERSLRTGSDRSVVYQVTERGQELRPALEALSRWGAATMTTPHEGEVITQASLVSALRAAARDHANRPSARAVYQIEAADAVAHATVDEHDITVEPGPHPKPDLTIVAGPRYRDLLAGTIAPADAVATGAAELHGNSARLDDFTRTFQVPYSPTLTDPPAGVAASPGTNQGDRS
ncbi:MAG: HxlR family transcriptional regulator [Gemmatimonas sp.]|nr:HxlR family transcriptional regulator [Gemmatimonas sp.]